MYACTTKNWGSEMCDILGPSIKYVTLFLANFDPPLPCHTLSHIPGPPKVRHTSRSLPPIFSRSSTKKPGQKPPVQILSQLFTGVFVREVFSGGLLSGRFCPGWLLSVPPSVRIHMLQQRFKHHFKFHVSYV